MKIPPLRRGLVFLNENLNYLSDVNSSFFYVFLLSPKETFVIFSTLLESYRWERGLRKAASAACEVERMSLRVGELPWVTT